MSTVIKMPQLGESVAEGTIGRWLKQPGERVERDEPLVEIQTDKVNAEVPSPVAGILQKILLPEGTTAAVKTDMAVIGDEPVAAEAEPADAPSAQGPEGTTTERTEAESKASAPPPLTFTYDKTAGGGVVGARDDEPQPEPQADSGGKRFYTPVVLRIAEEHNIDLSTVQGTGAHGRVTRRDVEQLIAGGSAPTDAAPPAEVVPPAPPAPHHARRQPTERTRARSPPCGARLPST